MIQNNSLPNFLAIFSEWSEMEETLGTPLQVAGGCLDK